MERWGFGGAFPCSAFGTFTQRKGSGITLLKMPMRSPGTKDQIEVGHTTCPPTHHCCWKPLWSKGACQAIPADACLCPYLLKNRSPLPRNKHATYLALYPLPWLAIYQGKPLPTSPPGCHLLELLPGPLPGIATDSIMEATYQSCSICWPAMEPVRGAAWPESRPVVEGEA